MLGATTVSFKTYDPMKVTLKAFLPLDGFQCSNATTVPNSQYKPGRYCKKFLHNHHQCLGTSTHILMKALKIAAG